MNFKSFVYLALSLGSISNALAESITSKPALNVTVIHAESREFPVTLLANGSIAAWQEAIIGSEISDLRLSQINVDVGDTVHKGQVLALLNAESVNADVANSRALVAEAEANLAQAHSNAIRSQQIIESGALSQQQIDQYVTSEKTAQAKLQSAKAQLDAQLLRLKYTQVVASDEGVITSRSATLGAVVSKGQELFRLIRQNRLEWRAELSADEMLTLKPGLSVNLKVATIGKVKGKIRTLAPTLDTQNRNGLVYVDLPNAFNLGLRAGMFAKGEFQLAVKSGLSVPQSAVSLREGFSYVFKVNEKNTVNQIKVTLGQQFADFFEIRAGVNPEDRLVASGVTFLNDGDLVRLVQP